MKQSRNKPVTFWSILESFVVFVSGFWFFQLLLTSILFIFKRPLSSLNLIISFVLAILFIFWYARKKFKNFLLLGFLSIYLFFITFFPALIISGKVFDLSYDGQAYHQEAVIQLVHGWNPVYKFLEHEATANLERWLNHYPKAAWIVEASVYQVVGNIEYGKVFSIYAGILAFAFVLWALSDVPISTFVKISISFLLAFNPVVIYQSLSFYLDGILVSLLLALLAVCFKIIKSRDKTLIYPFIFIFSIVVNVKLTALVFAGITVCAFILYLWLRNKLRMALTLFKYLFVSIILGVFLIGYNPYFINFATKGHPLYPAMGRNALDYVPTNIPENYWKIPSPLRLFASFFATSSLVRGKGQNASYKLPFTFSAKELETFRETNAKTGGFGPLFSGIFVVSVMILILYLTLGIIAKEKRISLMFATLAILGSASLVATSSVARFVPFVWWVPGLIVLYISSQEVYRLKPVMDAISIDAASYFGATKFLRPIKVEYFPKPKFLWKLMSFTLILSMIINLVLISYSYFPYNLKESRILKDQLTKLSEKTFSKPLPVYVGQFGSTKIKLQLFNIPFEEIYADSACKNSKSFLVGNISKICGKAGVASL